MVPVGAPERLEVTGVVFLSWGPFQYHRGTGAKTGAMVPVGAPERLEETSVVFYFFGPFLYHRGPGAKTGAMVPVGAPERLEEIGVVFLLALSVSVVERLPKLGFEGVTLKTMQITPAIAYCICKKCVYPSPQNPMG
jgi:hypothetical protein